MPPRRKLAECRREWNSEDNKDVVIFHMFPRNALSPSMSPYVLKLETFLRMHDVKYKVDHNIPMHPVTQKCPWVTFNGEDVADSQHIMEFLDAHPEVVEINNQVQEIYNEHLKNSMI